MDWANERYVRVYTRDTVDLIVMDWEARCVWWDLLRRVDRAGVLELGGASPSKGVAAVCRVPIDVAERCVAAWLADGCAELHGEGSSSRIVIPSFIDAQEAVQSDALRARVSRERRRDTSRNVTDPSRNVTEPSRAVTPCHAPSRRVTPSVPPVPPVPPVPEREAPPARTRRVARKGELLPRPDGWSPSESCRAAAREWNLDLTLEVQDFTSWTTSKGYRSADWDAAFRNHLVNSHKKNCARDTDRQAQLSERVHQERKAEPAAVLPWLGPQKPRAAPTARDQEDATERARRAAVASLAAMGGERG